MATLFTIDAASGQLTTHADLDHETQRDYEVIVTVSDGVANDAPDDPDDFIRVIIRVTNDPDDPADDAAVENMSTVLRQRVRETGSSPPAQWLRTHR